jgi:hypothetical protein
MSTRSNVHGGGRNLLSRVVVVGNDIARVATISVETTEPRGIIAVSLAVTPSQRVFDRKARVRVCVRLRMRYCTARWAFSMVAVVSHCRGREYKRQRDCRRP